MRSLNVLRSCRAWMILAGACLCVLNWSAAPAQPPASATPAGEAKPAETAATPEVKVSIAADDLVVKEGLVAKYKDKERVSKIITYRRPPEARMMTPADVPTLDGTAYNSLVSQLAIDEVLYDTAIKRNFVEQNEDIKSRLDEMKDRLLVFMYYQKSPAGNVKPTEEDLKKWYEENKKQYYRPYQFTMRHIFLSTYVSHTAKEGDTLEGLAETISKDKDMVKFILTDDTEKQARWIAPEEREEKLFKPLQPGEKLLVPMSKEEKEKVRKKMEEVKKALDEGADFEQTAQKYSDTEQKGVKIGPLRPEHESERGKPILPEILEVIEKTDSGKVSDIIQTKHGYQIYKVEDKQAAHTMPFEEVKNSIERTVTAKMTEDASTKLFMELAQKYKGGLTINRDILKAESPAPSDILVSAEDGLSVTMQAFMAQTADYKEKIKTDDDLIGALVKLRAINTWLLKKAALADGIQNTDEYKAALQEVNIGIVAPEFINKVITDSAGATEEVLKKYYEENKEHYKIPEQVDLYLIGRKISDDYANLSEEAKETGAATAIEALREETKGLSTFEQFKAFAAANSDEPSKEKSGSVGWVPLNYRNGFNGVLATLPAGKMSDPVAYGNSIYLLWVNEKKPASYRPFEEARDQVESNYRAAIASKVIEKLKEMVIIRAGLDEAFNATATSIRSLEQP